MKVAFISDIHGNYDALNAVLKQIKKLNVSKIYCLGDLVNYYYDPDKCIEVLIKNNVQCIRGNHEKIFFKTLKDNKKKNYYSKLYGNSIKNNLVKLNKKHIFFLKSLPTQKRININNSKILLAHGAPWKSDFYFYPNIKKKWFKKISKYKYDTIILGHTHIPMKIKLNKKKLLINTGSVGQPRDKTCNASWLLLDASKMDYKIIKTKYNKKRLKNQIKRYDSNNIIVLKFFKKCK